MNDQSVELLVQQLSRIQGKCLIVADENWAQPHGIASPIPATQVAPFTATAMK